MRADAAVASARAGHRAARRRLLAELRSIAGTPAASSSASPRPASAAPRTRVCAFEISAGEAVRPRAKLTQVALRRLDGRERAVAGPVVDELEPGLPAAPGATFAVDLDAVTARAFQQAGREGRDEPS